MTVPNHDLSRPGLVVRMSDRQNNFHLGSSGPFDEGLHREPMEGPQAGETSCLDADLVSGDDGAAEAGLFDLRQESRRTGREEQSRGLGHGLQEKYPGHERVVREVPLKVGLVRGDILEGDDSLSRNDVQDPVYEPERDAMRKVGERIPVHTLSLFLGIG